MAFVASFGFKYCGRIVLPGQVLRKLDGVTGDPSLITARYFVQFENTDKVIHCDGCNRDFYEAHQLEDHRRQNLCLDRDGKLIPDAELLEKTGLSRTDAQVVRNLPEGKRREMLGELPAMVGGGPGFGPG